ncbi:MAG: hypothetical protein KC620_00320 [Myxococcales bacterium]|nr:hypothetical protein [Myxococcales bacterium]
MQAWEAVFDDLGLLLDAIRTRYEPTLLAPLQHRMAVVCLRRAALDDLEAVRKSLGAGETQEAVLRQLDKQLEGDPSARPVLEAIRPTGRAQAMQLINEALEGDPDHAPSLRAAVALASVAGNWPEVVTWLERLTHHEEGKAAGQTWQQLGDIHWRKLSAPKAARPCYVEARQYLGDEPKLLDKQLKLDLELENWEDAIQTCFGLIAHMRRRPGRPEMAVTYMLTMGEIHVYGMRQPSIALAYYLMAMDTLPDYDLTYTLLQELLQTNPWAELEPRLDALPEEQAQLIAQPLDLLKAAIGTHRDNAPAVVKTFRESMSSRARR